MDSLKIMFFYVSIEFFFIKIDLIKKFWDKKGQAIFFSNKGLRPWFSNEAKLEHWEGRLRLESTLENSEFDQ